MEQQIERLVVRSRDGDRSAFDQLVVRFQKRVFYTIFKVVRDMHTANDLTQDVFITLYRKIEQIRDARTFVSWLYRVAMNKAIDSRRRQKREQSRVFLCDDFSYYASSTEAPGNGEDDAERRERALRLESRLREALDAMPERQRAVLLMSMESDMTQDDIALALDIPRGTVKSRLHHARKFLSVKLRDLWQGE